MHRLHLQNEPGDRLRDALNLSTTFFRTAGLCAAVLAVLAFANPEGMAVKADIVGPLNDGVTSEDLDEAAACQEMLAVTNQLAGTNPDGSDNSNNTTACGPAPQFAVESDKLNETLDVTHEELNNSNVTGDGGGVDVPTGAKPSPLFGAQPFTAKMLREEEFGPQKMGGKSGIPAVKAEFPGPQSPRLGPASDDLDNFLSYYVKSPTDTGGPDGLANPYPYPTEYTNDPDDPSYVAEAGEAGNENPWKTAIESYLKRSLNTPPAEGRPPGADWAHQRWEEFYPQVYFTSAQAGARENTGLRDRLQSHNYERGEWGPNGLYHEVFAGDGLANPIVGTTKGIPFAFHPRFPVQRPDAMWTFDGTIPPKLLRGRYGEGILFRHYNALPIDPSANLGFGAHTISTHEHNGHNPAESDGYTQAFFFPGQYYDYHWPMIPAGHDTVNTDASDPRMATPCRPGEMIRYKYKGDPVEMRPCNENGVVQMAGDYREVMGTHWFHDHMLDFTAQNVYKGNASMFNYYSAKDRGVERNCHYENPYNEASKSGNVNFCFPSGTAREWGNRDYDINLMLSDKAWDSEGQLFFNIFNKDGFLGDQILSNFVWKPYFDVRARRYRFRILNASVSRYMRIALVEQVQGNSGEINGPSGSNVSYNRVPFHMIANDGNIMEHTVHFDGNKTVAGFTNRKGILPTQAIAERYDIVVDFSQFQPGTKLFMVNLLEHRNGRRPHEAIPLAEVLNGEYHERNNATAANADVPVPQDGRYDTDPTVSRFLELRVHAYIDPETGEPGVDRSMNPADYEEGGMKMVPLPGFTQEELANAVHRTFEFARSNGTDESPWTIKTDGGTGYTMDPRRLTAAPTKDGNVEIWHLEGNGGWSHPIHVHFEEGQILNRDGEPPPEWEKWARKDVYRIGRMEDSTHSVTMAIRFREFLGTYMEHCHNTQHEDHAMLLRWDIENPNQVKMMPTPMPTWDGVGYVGSTALPTARRDGTPGGGDGGDPENIGPSVSLTPVSIDGETPFTVNFVATISDPDGDLVDAIVDWDFGDGISTSTPGTVSEQSHEYLIAGTFDVAVTVTDDRGASATATSTVTVTDPVPDLSAPVVSVPSDINVPTAPGETTVVVNYAAPTANDDQDGAITPTLAEGLPSGSLFPVGTTTVTYEATDDAGNTGSASFDVTVTATPADPENVLPMVSLTPVNPTGEAPYKLVFSATASDDDGHIVSYAWNFGDGGTSDRADVSHTYQNAGDYTATVTVTDNEGATASASTTVTVTEGEEPPVADTLTITRADYKLIRVRVKNSGQKVFVGKWVVRTKSSEKEGQTMSVWLGDPSHGVLLGSGTVNHKGFLKVGKRTKTPTLPVEGAYVTVVSDLGGEATQTADIIVDEGLIHQAHNN